MSACVIVPIGSSATQKNALICPCRNDPCLVCPFASDRLSHPSFHSRPHVLASFTALSSHLPPPVHHSSVSPSSRSCPLPKSPNSTRCSRRLMRRSSGIVMSSGRSICESALGACLCFVARIADHTCLIERCRFWTGTYVSPSLLRLTRRSSIFSSCTTSFVFHHLVSFRHLSALIRCLSASSRLSSLPYHVLTPFLLGSFLSFCLLRCVWNTRFALLCFVGCPLLRLRLRLRFNSLRSASLSLRERWLMEGSYTKVWRARERVPREEYAVLLDGLVGKIRCVHIERSLEPSQFRAHPMAGFNRGWR